MTIPRILLDCSMSKTPHFLNVAPGNIWLYEQNNPRLVVDDLKEVYPDIDPTVVERSLMARGINKWLKVRRDLIAHKKALRNEIKKIQRVLPDIKRDLSAIYAHPSQVERGEKTPQQLADYYQAQITYLKTKERLKFLEAERGTLKALCMTERWQDWRGKSVEDMNTLRASD